ncbi:MAG: hypothetical protein JOZ05_12570, partial [Acetobacteraceae bacterium]|nr:hypothetical protein [Acetobacteraceae bacterium]
MPIVARLFCGFVLLTPLGALAQSCNALRAEVAGLRQALANDRQALSNCTNHLGECTSGQIESWQAAIQTAGEEIDADLQRERTACAPPPPPNLDHLMLQGMEVTQAVQDMANSVALIAGKTTWVRVYFDKNNGTRLITARLQATRSGGVTTTIVPAANVTVDANDSLQTRRTNWSKSLNFLLPSPVVASGSVNFNLVSLSSPGGPSISCDSCANTTQVTFYNEPPLIVRAI